MVDVVCLGESLGTFRPAATGQGLAAAALYRRGTGGAESNVACALAAAGHRVRWVSRLGDDAFGDEILRSVAAAGVDVSAVARDTGRPTGIYFRTDGDRGRDLETAYYRAGSAASAMAPDNVPAASWSGCRLLHLTGITAALSDSCRALLRRLTAAHPRRPLVSFDVNFRPQLWRRGATGGQAGPETLLRLARASDLVFVGEDEAAAAWGVTGGPAAVRAALPEPAAVVVKRHDHGAVLFTAAGEVAVPAPAVEVTAPVGAGDGFAAGYLSALLDGAPAARRLRRGHLFAAAVLVSDEDHAPPPPPALTARLTALPDDDWRDLRLATGWTGGDGAAPGEDPPAPARAGENGAGG